MRSLKKRNNEKAWLKRAALANPIFLGVPPVRVANLIASFSIISHWVLLFSVSHHGWINSKRTHPLPPPPPPGHFWGDFFTSHRHHGWAFATILKSKDKCPGGGMGALEIVRSGNTVKRKYIYLLVMIMMNTVDADQVVRIWYRVAELLIIVVLKQGCLTAVRVVTFHVTAAEAKPKTKMFSFKIW